MPWHPTSHRFNRATPALGRLGISHRFVAKPVDIAHVKSSLLGKTFRIPGDERRERRFMMKAALTVPLERTQLTISGSLA